MNGRKVLVTGAAGQIASPICEHLATTNEVWGLDVFPLSGSRERLESSGVNTWAGDVASGIFTGLPDDFDYVIHLAAYLAPDHDYDAALRVNAEGTGLLLSHCRSARGALVMSSVGVYEPVPDPWHEFRESDALGDAHSPYVPTYGVTKIAQEAVARTCARVFDLPVVIARMNTAYGPNGGMPAHHLDAIIEGRDVTVRHDPMPANPIYQQDINTQVEALLGAASVPAPVVNWGGDEVVTQQEWCAHLGELTERPARVVLHPEGKRRGGAVDVSRRREITGPCAVDWREGMRLMVEGRYPDGPDGRRIAGAGAAHALDAYERRESPAS